LPGLPERSNIAVLETEPLMLTPENLLWKPLRKGTYGCLEGDYASKLDSLGCGKSR
jgi:hypothetical protein